MQTCRSASVWVVNTNQTSPFAAILLFLGPCCALPSCILLLSCSRGEPECPEREEGSGVSGARTAAVPGSGGVKRGEGSAPRGPPPSWELGPARAGSALGSSPRTSSLRSWQGQEMRLGREAARRSGWPRFAPCPGAGEWKSSYFYQGAKRDGGWGEWWCVCVCVKRRE